MNTVLKRAASDELNGIAIQMVKSLISGIDLGMFSCL